MATVHDPPALLSKAMARERPLLMLLLLLLLRRQSWTTSHPRLQHRTLPVPGKTFQRAFILWKILPNNPLSLKIGVFVNFWTWVFLLPARLVSRRTPSDGTSCVNQWLRPSFCRSSRARRLGSAPSNSLILWLKFSRKSILLGRQLRVKCTCRSRLKAHLLIIHRNRLVRYFQIHFLFCTLLIYPVLYILYYKPTRLYCCLFSVHLYTACPLFFFVWQMQKTHSRGAPGLGLGW